MNRSLWSKVTIQAKDLAADDVVCRSNGHWYKVLEVASGHWITVKFVQDRGTSTSINNENYLPYQPVIILQELKQ